MVTVMDKNEENQEKTLQLGADLPRDLVLRFRKQAEERKFKKKEILEQFARWWLSLDVERQREFYHQSICEEPEHELYGPKETYLSPEKKAFRREVLLILREVGVLPAKGKQAKKRPPLKKSAKAR
jgi:hypothetical protein